MTGKTPRDRIGKLYGVIVITISARHGNRPRLHCAGSYLTRSGTAGSLLAVNHFAADDRGFHFRVANGFWFQANDVVAHYHHVCEFAG